MQNAYFRIENVEEGREHFNLESLAQNYESHLVDLSGIARGEYLLEILSGGKSIKAATFVKQ